MDLYDYKPHLAKGSGQPLPYKLPETEATVGLDSTRLLGPVSSFKHQGECGLYMSDLLPHTARHADDLCVIRSMQGEIANHTPGLLLTNCGHSTLPRPSLGSWLLYGLGNESENLPGFVVLMPKGMPTAQSRNWTIAFLPGVYQGTHIETDSADGDPIPNLTRRDIRPARSVRRWR